uniref:SET domain-containing protein n=1 Tax=Meloidogyne enterolobii TaxID=390850 RepID=A0A6V7W3T7_MELEN|nr:unnamed protein product [Meloidogyne enterolobii]
MTEDIYKVDDLSNGLEKNKLAVVNKYNYENLPPFEYILGVELSPELKDSFTNRENFCKCLITDCANNIRDQCSCNDKTAFCCSLCSCSSQTEANCSKRYLPLNCLFQVFYVNPQKKWGLRTLNFIKKGSILFEYGGILSEDKDGIEDDDYIYLFDYKDKKYIINAHKKGNLARFANHSCAANCYTQVSEIDETNVPHLIIVAARDIYPGEEITLNYGHYWWNVKMINSNLICSCESFKCQYSSFPDQNGFVNGENHLTTENGECSSGIRSSQCARKFAGPNTQCARKIAVPFSIRKNCARKAVTVPFSIPRNCARKVCYEESDEITILSDSEEEEDVEKEDVVEKEEVVGKEEVEKEVGKDENNGIVFDDDDIICIEN